MKEQINGMEMNGLSNKFRKYTVVFMIFQYVSAVIFYFTIFLNSGFGDGATGMAPLSMLLGILISALISVIIGAVLQKKIELSLMLPLNYLFFEIAHLLFSGDIPIFRIFKNGLSGDLARIESVAFVTATLFVFCIYLLFRKLMMRQEENKT